MFIVRFIHVPIGCADRGGDFSLSDLFLTQPVCSQQPFKETLFAEMPGTGILRRFFDQFLSRQQPPEESGAAEPASGRFRFRLLFEGVG